MQKTEDIDAGHIDLEGEIVIDQTRLVNVEGAFGELFCGTHPKVSNYRLRGSPTGELTGIKL